MATSRGFLVAESSAAWRSRWVLSLLLLPWATTGLFGGEPDARNLPDDPDVQNVPNGSPVLPNGFFGEMEWADALTVELADGLTVQAKVSGEFLLLAVRDGETVHTGIDLFLAADAGNQRRYHVSSALAESRWVDGEWDEVWETNHGWVANKIGLFQLGGERRTSAPEGFEFQLLRRELPSTRIYLALQLKRPERAVPSIELRQQFKGWIELTLPEDSEALSEDSEAPAEDSEAPAEYSEAPAHAKTD